MSRNLTRILVVTFVFALLLLAVGSVAGSLHKSGGLIDSLVHAPRPVTPLDRAGVLDPVLPAVITDTVKSLRFWDTPLQSGVIAFSNSQSRTIPGPDDQVRVIVQLKGDPISVYLARNYRHVERFTAAESIVVQRYADQLVAERRQVLTQLEQQHIAATVNYEFRYAFNGLALSVKMRDWSRLEALQQVAQVVPDYMMQADLSQSVPLIGAPSVWAMTDPAGHTVNGQGVRVAIVDTGIDYTHPDLGNGFGPTHKVAGGYDFINFDNDPMDDHGHGTHVAGIVAANGTLKGVAPGASLLAYKVLDAAGSGPTSAVMAGLERAADPDGNPATDDGADVINLSLGGPGDPDDPLCQAVDNIVGRGIVVVASAGNSGPGYETLDSPAVARAALTVAASDKNDQLADFSSRGPVRNYRSLLKPDMTAPGVSIRSTVPAGGELGSPDRYRYLDGTSMAAPHVAGAAALIKQMHPTWTPAMIKANLMNTAKDLSRGAYEQGAGRVQVTLAATAPLVATPGSFGFDQLVPGVVTSTQVTVFNTSAAPITATASISTILWDNGDLSGTQPPVPVAYAQLAETDLSIPAGEAHALTVTLTIPADAAGGYYTGQLILHTANGTLHVPFALTLLSKVTVHMLDENGVEWLDPWSYTVYLVRVPDADVQKNSWSMNNPPFTFMIPPGTYHVFGYGRIYWYTPLLEGWSAVLWKPMLLATTTTITQNSDMDLILDARSARHFTLDATTFAGDPLFVHQMDAGYLYQTGEHTYKAMFGFSYADSALTDFHSPMPRSLDLYISDTPADTHFSIGVAGFGFSPRLQHFNELNTAKWYRYTDPQVRPGLAYRQWADEVHLFAWEFPAIDATTPTTLSYARNEVGRYHLKYDLPGTLTYSPAYDGGLFSGFDTLSYLPHGLFPFAAQASVGIERDVFYRGPFYYQLWPTGGYQSSARTFVDRDLQPLPPADESFQIGGGPLYPAVTFDNDASTVRFSRPAVFSSGGNYVNWNGGWSWLTLDRDGAQVYGAYVNNLEIPNTDWVIGSLEPGHYRWLMPVVNDTPVANYNVLEAGFTLSSTVSDLNPPRIIALDMPQRFAAHQSITATLTITDFESGVNNVQARYSVNDGQSWAVAPVIHQGDQYRIRIDPGDVLGVSLNYTVTDNVGNYLAFTTHPTAIRETPVNLSLNVTPLTVPSDPYPVTLHISGTLRTWDNQPLASVGLPIMIKVNDQLAGYVRDMIRRPDGTTEFGRIDFDWTFIPTDFVTTTMSTVPLEFVFDVGTYARQEQTFDLNVAEFSYVYLPAVLNNYAALHASFTATPATGIAPLTVVFANTSTGSPGYTSSHWEFGDGVTSTLTSPSHTYALPGTYTATLTVANNVETSATSLPIAVLSGRELIVNGNFETDEAWEFATSPDLAGYTATVAHAGQRSAKLGVVPPEPYRYGYALLSQRITLPVTASVASLSFWYWPRREDGSIPLAQTRQFVYVLDDQMQVLQTLVETSDDAGDWRLVTFDLSSLAGRTIILQFGVFNEGDMLRSKRTAMYVDDVSLVVPAHELSVNR